MTDASNALHEPVELLTSETLEVRRGILSLVEEFEAVAWYDQRIAATEDSQLRAILTHNRDEEKEHAVMALEWLRRRDPALDAQMRTYLFTQGSIVDIEPDTSETEAAETRAPAGSPETGLSLGIGSLQGDR